MPESKRPLKVFLCHASQDKPAVRELYRRLVRDGVDVWLDETNLLPGMDWQLEIPRAVRNADAIIICLSDKSVTKEGYVQKEIRFALDAADEKPDGTIYLIPVRLNECIIPSRLTRWQWVDYFSSDGYRKLRLSLRLRAESIGAVMYSTDRKQESGSVDARNSSAKTTAGYKVHFGLVGMIFALLLAVSGILWAGGRMFNAETPSLMPTSSLTPMETMTVTQTATLTPFQPNLMPVATTGLLIPL